LGLYGRGFRGPVKYSTARMANPAIANADMAEQMADQQLRLPCDSGLSSIRN
jgi:hypothetical protein